MGFNSTLLVLGILGLGGYYVYLNSKKNVNPTTPYWIDTPPQHWIDYSKLDRAVYYGSQVFENEDPFGIGIDPNYRPENQPPPVDPNAYQAPMAPTVIVPDNSVQMQVPVTRDGVTVDVPIINPFMMVNPF